MYSKDGQSILVSCPFLDNVCSIRNITSKLKTNQIFLICWIRLSKTLQKTTPKIPSSYWASSCRLLLPLEFVSGTSSTGVLSLQEVGVRRVRVFMLRCSRDRASCFLERSCNIRAWWSFIFCNECLSETRSEDSFRWIC